MGLLLLRLERLLLRVETLLQRVELLLLRRCWLRLELLRRLLLLLSESRQTCGPEPVLLLCGLSLPRGEHQPLLLSSL